MSRNANIILSILGAGLLICVCGGVVAFFVLRQAGTFVEQSFVTDPEEAAQKASEVTDFQVPEGWKENVVSFFGFDVIMITPANDDPDKMIMIMQFPESAGLSEEQMQEQMNQALQQQMSREGIEFKVVDQQTTNIRGEEVTLTVQEGTDNSGRTIRQAGGVFQGNKGPAMMVIISPVDDWDQAEVDAFLNSIQ